MIKPRVLICDDEMLIRLWLGEHLAEAGYNTETVENGKELLAAFSREPADLVLLDLRLPGETGLELLPKLKAMDATLPVIMMSAYGEVETAVAAVRAGAFHFLEKPIALPELALLLEQALETRRLRSDVDRYRETNSWQFADVALVGRSPALRRIAETIARVGSKGSAVNILIRGESGTGKDVVARAIHARGPRRSQPFISVNCTAMPEHLVESELFGHEAGAYTDAKEAKKGLFELADRGTLFLDEIGDMPRALQAKLLQVLESHRFRRIGGVRDIEVDVHVITATNRDLEAAQKAGEFREDLFYRLNVLPIVMPPLRDRPEDIQPLATHFGGVLARELGQPTRELAPEVARAFDRYAWPGNARELRNVLERILLIEDDTLVRLEHLPPTIAGIAPTRPNALVLPAEGLDLDQTERELIVQAMARAGGNKTAAARLLGLTRDTMRYRLEKFGIQ